MTETAVLDHRVRTFVALAGMGATSCAHWSGMSLAASAGDTSIFFLGVFAFLACAFVLGRQRLDGAMFGAACGISISAQMLISPARNTEFALFTFGAAVFCLLAAAALRRVNSGSLPPRGLSAGDRG